jgi:hypothetical protein
MPSAMVVKAILTGVILKIVTAALLVIIQADGNGELLPMVLLLHIPVLNYGVLY